MSFSGFLKEYSIVGTFLKEKFVIKTRCLMKAYLAFTPYYHEMPNWYNIGNLSLLISKIAGAMEITATRKIGEGKNNEKPIKRITFRMLGFNQKSFLSNGIVNFKLCQRNSVRIFYSW